MRMDSRPRLVALAIAMLFAVATLSACGGSSANNTDAASAQPRTVEIPVRWASGNAADLGSLLRSNPVAFVGTVVRLKEQRDVSLSEASLTGARSPSFPVSFFEVRVDEAWSQGVEPGSTVIVQQAGGVASGPDGDVRYVLDADEPLEAGAAYLFFASESPIEASALVTSPYARLELSDDGQLQPLSQWSHLKGLQAVAGLGVEQARSVVDSAGRSAP